MGFVKAVVVDVEPPLVDTSGNRSANLDFALNDFAAMFLDHTFCETRHFGSDPWAKLSAVDHFFLFSAHLLDLQSGEECVTDGAQNRPCSSHPRSTPMKGSKLYSNF